MDDVALAFPQTTGHEISGMLELCKFHHTKALLCGFKLRHFPEFLFQNAFKLRIGQVSRNIMDNNAAILFVHGFTGRAVLTEKQIPSEFESIRTNFVCT
jgi:hypothetical protein